jgi:uncharacterized membrane protein YedE/YeeE
VYALAAVSFLFFLTAFFNTASGGAVAVGFIYIQLSKEKELAIQPLPTWILILAGLCVGFGTRVGCGCTSGHGISGMSRLSKRSFVGVGAFMTTAVITANAAYYKSFPKPDLTDPTWCVRTACSRRWMCVCVCMGV